MSQFEELKAMLRGFAEQDRGFIEVAESVNTQAIEAIESLERQLAEKDAEIEHLDRTKAEWRSVAYKQGSSLAAQELVIQQLRDALNKIANSRVGQVESITQELFNREDWAREALTIPTSTKPLEAWYKEQVGEPVAYMQISVEEGVDTKFPRDHLPKKYNKEWWKFEPLHAIKPFPFKEK